MDENKIETRPDEEAGEPFFLEYFNTDWIFSTIKRADYLLLRAIQVRAGERGKPGRTYLADLAAGLNMPIPTLSRTVERLQDKGLVTWKTDRAAGQTYVRLTNKAVELMDDESRRMRAASRRVREEIDGEELDRAIETARKIAEILKESKRTS